MGDSSSSSSGMPRMYQIMATRRTATTTKKMVLEVEALKREEGVGTGIGEGLAVGVAVGEAMIFLMGAAKTGLAKAKPAAAKRKEETRFFIRMIMELYLGACQEVLIWLLIK